MKCFKSVIQKLFQAIPSLAKSKLGPIKVMYQCVVSMCLVLPSLVLALPSLDSHFIGPTIILSGESSLYSLDITNETSYPSQSGLAYVFTLPNNLSFTGSLVSNNCGGSVVLSSTGTSTNNTLSMTGGNLNVGNAGCSVQWTVTGVISGTYNILTSNATVTNLTNNINTSLVINPIPKLFISDSADTIIGGQTGSYTFTIDNTIGRPSWTGLGFVNTFASTLTLGVPSSTCTGANLVKSGSTLTVTNIALANGEAGCTVTMPFTTPKRKDATLFCNYTITGTSGQVAGYTTSSTLLLPSAVMVEGEGKACFYVHLPWINKLNNNTEIRKGQGGIYRIVIYNSIILAAVPNLQFTDTLATHLTVGVPTNTCNGSVTVVGRAVTLSNGSFNDGDVSCTVTIPFTVRSIAVAGSSICNYATNAGLSTPTSNLEGYITNLNNIAGMSLTSIESTGVDGNTDCFTVLGQTIYKSVNVGTLPLGGAGRYTIQIFNPAGELAQSGLGFVDEFPSALTITTTSNTCGGSLTVVGNTVTLSGGSLAAGGAAGVSCQVLVNFTLNTSLNTGEKVCNAIGGGTASQYNGYLTNITPANVLPPFNVAEGVTIGCIRPPGIAIPVIPILTIADNVTVLAPTQAGIYTYTITNPAGNTAQTGTGFSATLPVHAVLNTASITTNCVGANITTLANSFTIDSISLPGGAAASTCTVTVPFNVIDTPTSNFSNVCNIVYTGYNSYINTTNNLAQTALLTEGFGKACFNVRLPVLTKSDVGVTYLELYQTSSYVLTITNPAGYPAVNNFEFTDTLPTGLIVGPPNTALPSTTCGAANFSLNASAVTVTNGAIAAGPSSCTITIPFMVSDPLIGAKYACNNLTAGTPLVDQGFLSNPKVINPNLSLSEGSGKACFDVKSVPVLNKDFSPNNISTGMTSLMTLTVSNGAGTPVQNQIDFLETLPVGLRVQNFVSNTCGGSVTVSANTVNPGTVQLTGGSLLPSQGSCIISAYVISDALNIYENQQSNVTGTHNLVNNAAATLVVSNTPYLTKAFSPAILGKGGVTSLVFTITNPPGTLSINNINFSDTLPSGLMIANTTVTGTCVNAALATNVTTGGNTIQVTNLVVPASNSCTVIVKVTNTASTNIGVCPRADTTNGFSNISNLNNLNNSVTSQCLPIVTPSDMTVNVVVPPITSPGFVGSGTVICTASAGAAYTNAINPTCGLSGVDSTGAAISVTITSCNPTQPVATLSQGSQISCNFTFQTPGTQGGHDTVATSVTFTGVTSADNEGVLTNNSTTASSVLLDAIDDGTIYFGSNLTGMTFNLVNNDQNALLSTSNVNQLPGTTCPNTSIDVATGIATFDVPNESSCVIEYQVCVSGLGGVCDFAQVTVVGQTTDLTMQKNGPATVLAGGQFSYTLTISNVGPGSAHRSTYQDILPAGVTLISAECSGVQGGAVCAQPTLVGNSQVTGQIPTFPAGSAATITIVVQAPLSGVTTLSNTATVTVSNNSRELVLNNNSSTVVTQVTAVQATVADVSITKSGPSTVAVGGTVSYYVTVVNAGPGEVIGAVLKDPVVAGLNLTSISCNFLTNTGGAVCPTPGSLNINSLLTSGIAIPLLPNSSSVTFLVTGTHSLPTGSAISNTATVSVPANIIDPNTANNSSTSIAQINTPTLNANLSAVKLGTTSVQTGGVVRYQLILSNNGPDAADGASYQDVIPAALSGISAVCEVPSYSTAQCGLAAINLVGNTLSGTLASFPAGSVVMINITATAPNYPVRFSNSVSITPPTNVLDTDPTDNISGPVFTQVLGLSAISGVVWKDSNRNEVRDPSETQLQGVIVKVYNRNGALVGTTTTDSSGAYVVTGLPPATGYKVTFDFGSYVQGLVIPQNTDSQLNGSVMNQTTIQNITLAANMVTLEQNARVVDPSGVVYDSITRLPLAGARVRLIGPAGVVPNWSVGCTYCLAPATPNNTLTGSSGAYAFFLSAGPTGQYTIEVTPAPNYLGPIAQFGGVPAPLSSITVPAAPGTVFVQPQSTAPAVGVTGAAAQYTFTLSGFGMASQDVVNNHIPLDTLAGTRIVLSKTGNKTIVELGDTLQYTLVVSRADTVSLVIPKFVITDLLPAGFVYIPGTATVNGTAVTDVALGINNQGASAQLNMLMNYPLASGAPITVTYRVRIGVGALEGSATNLAQAKTDLAINCSVAPLNCSNIARYTVKFTAGVFTTQACVLGKVYADCNRNWQHDDEEMGIPGVRLYLLNGTSVTTDSEGKYSYCDLKPSTQVIMVDTITMPRGSVFGFTSNRNSGDGASLFVDLKKGELHRADFTEASCSNLVLEQIRARRSRGEVRAVETEQTRSLLKYQTKPESDVIQTTDGANQPAIIKR